MAGIDQNTLWQLASMILGKSKAQPTTRERATFLRTDSDGTQWVRLPSSNDETPVNGRTLATAKAGDTVEWSIDNGRLSITGNESQPSVGMREVFQTASDIVQPVVARVTKVSELATLSKNVADAAQQVADAVNQHFFSDTNGVHVTEATQEDWEESHEGANVLINALGQLFRDGLNNLLTLTTEGNARALTVWDGLGNAAANVRAVIGETITLGNASDGSVVTIDSDSLDMVHGTTEMLHFGYGEGTSASGTSVAPYYSIGKRKANSTVGNYSMAEGYDTTASGYTSHAEGYGTTANGDHSHAEGLHTTASGYAAHAEGNVTTASGYYSHAQNYGTIAASDYQTAMGRYNANDSSHALEIGNGTSYNARSNALTVDWDGNVVAAGTVTASNVGVKTTSHSASSVTISAGGNYYASLGSLTAVDGFVPVGVSFNLTGMSNYANLFPSALQDNGTYIWARIHNFNSSSSTGDWSATVYWVASN